MKPYLKKPFTKKAGEVAPGEVSTKFKPQYWKKQ
jgi:hypothetical protein